LLLGGFSFSSLWSWLLTLSTITTRLWLGGVLQVD